MHLLIKLNKWTKKIKKVDINCIGYCNLLKRESGDSL